MNQFENEHEKHRHIFKTENIQIDILFEDNHLIAINKKPSEIVQGDKTGDDAIRVLSADGLEVIVDLTVLYRVLPNEAPRILKEIGTDYRNTIVRPLAIINKKAMAITQCRVMASLW